MSAKSLCTLGVVARRVVAATVICIALLLGALPVHADAPLTHASGANLFELPLKEVLEIRVDGTSSSIASSQKVKVYDSDRFLNELHSKANDAQSILNSPTLLLIDGHSIERLDTLRDSENYIAFFGESASRVEVYSGQYTRYLSSRRVRTVVNIVTTKRHSEEVSQ